MAEIFLGTQCVYGDSLCNSNEFLRTDGYYSEEERKFYSVESCATTCSVEDQFSPGHVLDSWCVGTTLYEAVYSANGAGFIRTTPNSSSCPVGSCSLAITSITPVNESTYLGNNGSVTIVISGGTADYIYKTYSANLDTAYLSSSTTGSFTDLAPGNYNVIVSDNNKCIATGTFTINAAASTYGAKYTHTHKDLDGNSHKVDIFERGYVGATEEIEKSLAGGFRFEKYGDGRNQAYPIKASKLEINWWSETNNKFTSLFTADEKKYKVVRYFNGTAIWTGYLFFDMYMEEYVTPPFGVKLTASDGLGLLKGYKFASDNGEPYTGEKSYLEIVTLILNKLGLNLGIWTTVTRYPTGLTELGANDPFAETSRTMDFYYKDLNNIPSCYDVLFKILSAWNAEIMQDRQNNVWYIRQIEAITDGSYPVRKYNYLGVYQSNTTVNKVVNVGGINTVNPLPILDAVQTLMPAYKVSNIEQDYGAIENLTPSGNYDAKYWVNSTTLTTGVVIGNIERITINDDKSFYGLLIKYLQDTNQLEYYHQLESIPYTYQAGTLFNFSARCKLYSLSNPAPGEKKISNVTNNSGTIRVAVSNHGYNTGDIIVVKQVEGITGINTQWTITKITNDVFDLDGSTYSGTYKQGTGTVAPPLLFALTQVEISLNNTYYLNNKGEWSTAYQTITVNLNDLNKWQTIQVLSKEIPVTGTIRVKLFNMTQNLSFEPEGVLWSLVSTLFYPDGLPPKAKTLIKSSQTGLFTYETGQFEVWDGDAPEGDNSENAYQNGIYYGGNHTTTWYRGGKAEARPFLELTQQVIMNNYRANMKKIEGRIKRNSGMNYIYPDSVVKYPTQEGSTLFIVDRYVENTQDQEYEVTLLEVRNG